MKTLYLECYSGISGDMTVAALLDLGADLGGLLELLDSINTDEFEIRTGRALKNGISAYDFDVILHEHDHIGGCSPHEDIHDHAHEHHHEHGQDHEHHHEHSHDHEHYHEHGQDHEHHHKHRNIADIYKIIDNMNSSDRVKQLSRKMFDAVAKAEAEAHDLPVDQVHFHEVGATDSIVDIISTAFCIDDLGIDKVIVSDLFEGKGYVQCQHGIIPVPVPAVINIAREHGLRLKMTETEGEMITPTGAAIAAVLGSGDPLPDEFVVKATGTGAGKKDFRHANILRAFIIDYTELRVDDTAEDIFEIETNIDDSTGESLAFALQELMDKGARDAFYVPIVMKKNRPAYMLKVICDRQKIDRMCDIIFKHTSTIGVRMFPVERRILPRRSVSYDLDMGRVEAKVIIMDGSEYIVPEAESIAAICRSTERGWQEVYAEAIREMNK